MEETDEILELFAKLEDDENKDSSTMDVAPVIDIMAESTLWSSKTKTVPPLKPPRRLKKQLDLESQRVEAGWKGMKKQEITETVKKDLQIL